MWEINCAVVVRKQPKQQVQRTKKNTLFVLIQIRVRSKWSYERFLENNLEMKAYKIKFKGKIIYPNAN